MPRIVTPPSNPAATRPAQDSQWVDRPWSHASSDQDEAVMRWQSLVDRGLIGGNPPTAPEVVAQRAANDAQFRRYAADRRRLKRERGW